MCGPDLGHNVVVPPPVIPTQVPTQPPASERVARLRFRFSKTGAMALLSHLDVVRMLERSLRRSGLPVSFTGGFHPLPRLQLALALPLGVEAHGEWMDLEFLKAMDPEEVMQAWQQTLPDDFRLLSAQSVPVSEPSLSQRLASAQWRFSLSPASSEGGRDAFVESVALACRGLMESGQLMWHDTDKKGRPRERDCRPSLLDLRCQPCNGVGAPVADLELHAAIDAMGRSLKPSQIQHWLQEQLNQDLQMERVQRLALLLQ